MLSAKPSDEWSNGPRPPSQSPNAIKCTLKTNNIIANIQNLTDGLPCLISIIGITISSKIPLMIAIIHVYFKIANIGNHCPIFCSIHRALVFSRVKSKPQTK